IVGPRCPGGRPEGSTPIPGTRIWGIRGRLSPMCAGPRGTHSGAMETTTNPQDSSDHTTEAQGPSYVSKPALVRPVRGRMLAGVAEGAADYFGVDPTIVRIA